MNRHAELMTVTQALIGETETLATAGTADTEIKEHSADERTAGTDATASHTEAMLNWVFMVLVVRLGLCGARS